MWILRIPELLSFRCTMLFSMGKIVHLLCSLAISTFNGHAVANGALHVGSLTGCIGGGGVGGTISKSSLTMSLKYVMTFC